MPLYTVSTGDPLHEKLRAEIASFITETHCDQTGAPPTFVNVMFWTGVPLRSEHDIHLFGSVRAGRNEATKSKLEARLVDGLARLASVEPRRVGYAVFEVPARMVMEGGVVLPEPGEEEAWLQAHEQAAPDPAAEQTATSIGRSTNRPKSRRTRE